jgi:glutamyl/glutaminyl-tRNA synthetase
MNLKIDELGTKMQAWGLLETPVPEAARRWIATFLEAYADGLTAIDDAYAPIVALRDEGVIVPAIELERLRSRDVLFFLDTFAQYVDHQAELRGLQLRHDIGVMAEEFGLAREAGYDAVRMAITGEKDGPALELLAPLLGHDRILMRIGAVNSKLLHGRGLEPIAYGPDGQPFEPIRGKKPE